MYNSIAGLRTNCGMRLVAYSQATNPFFADLPLARRLGLCVCIAYAHSEVIFEVLF